MNKKQFFILVVVGLVVGGLGIHFYNKQKGSYNQGEVISTDRVLPKFPLNEIAHVRIKQTGSEVNLVKSNETWTVRERYNYPANFTQVGDLLRKLWELKPIRDIEVGPSQYGRLELLNPNDSGATNAATLAEFKDKSDKDLQTVLFGKKYTKESGPSPFGGGGGGEFPVGRYLLVPGNPGRVWLVSEAFTDLEPKPEQWLNKDFFKIEKLKSISVDDPKRTNSWKASRETETGEWKVADVKETEQTDTSKTSSLSYLLSSPSFNDIAAPDSKPEVTGLNEPLTAKLETFEGFAYTLNLGGKTNAENFYLALKVDGNFPKERPPGKDEKPEDKEKLDKEFKEKTDKLQEKLKKEKSYEGWTYQVSKWTIDPLLKERKDLVSEKKEEKKPETPANKKDSSAPPLDLLPDELKNFQPPPPVPEAPVKKPVAKPEEKKADNPANPAPSEKKPDAEKKPENDGAEPPK
jgi:hypothetical protein